jgi:hypothetical protein
MTFALRHSNLSEKLADSRSPQKPMRLHSWPRLTVWLKSPIAWCIRWRRMHHRGIGRKKRLRQELERQCGMGQRLANSKLGPGRRPCDFAAKRLKIIALGSVFQCGVPSQPRGRGVQFQIGAVLQYSITPRGRIRGRRRRRGRPVRRSFLRSLVGSSVSERSRKNEAPHEHRYWR